MIFAQSRVVSVTPGDPDPLGRGQGCYQLNPNGDPVGITFLRYEEASDLLWFRAAKRDASGSNDVSGTNYFIAPGQLNFVVSTNNGSVVITNESVNYYGHPNGDDGNGNYAARYVDVAISGQYFPTNTARKVKVERVGNPYYVSADLTVTVVETTVQLATPSISEISENIGYLQEVSNNDPRAEASRYMIAAANPDGSIPFWNAPCGFDNPVYNEIHLYGAMDNLTEGLYYASKRIATTQQIGNGNTTTIAASNYSYPFPFYVTSNGSVTADNSQPIEILLPEDGTYFASGTDEITFAWDQISDIKKVRLKLKRQKNDGAWENVFTQSQIQTSSFNVLEEELNGIKSFEDGYYKASIKEIGGSYEAIIYFYIGGSNTSYLSAPELANDVWISGQVVGPGETKLYRVYVPSQTDYDNNRVAYLPSAMTIKLDGEVNGSGTGDLQLFVKHYDPTVSSTHYDAYSKASDSKEMVLIDQHSSRGFDGGLFTSGPSTTNREIFDNHTLQTGNYYILVSNNSTTDVGEFSIKAELIDIHSPMTYENITISAGYNDPYVPPNVLANNPNAVGHHDHPSSGFAFDLNTYESGRYATPGGFSDMGRRVVATSDGVIMNAQYDTYGAGEYIRQSIGDIEDVKILSSGAIEPSRWFGYAAVYFHLAEFSVSPGQFVQARQEIALLGTTGTGSVVSHLHYALERGLNGDHPSANGERLGIKPEPLNTMYGPMTDLRHDDPLDTGDPQNTTFEGENQIHGSNLLDVYNVKVVDEEMAYTTALSGPTSWSKEHDAGYENDYLYVTDRNDSYFAEYAAPITETGRYGVWAYIPCIKQGNNQSSCIQSVQYEDADAIMTYRVHHQNGVSCVEVDQSEHGSQWVFLGYYTFKVNDSKTKRRVTISSDEADAIGTIAIDAIMFALEGSGPDRNNSGNEIHCNSQFQEPYHNNSSLPLADINSLGGDILITFNYSGEMAIVYSYAGVELHRFTETVQAGQVELYPISTPVSGPYTITVIDMTQGSNQIVSETHYFTGN